MSDAQPESTGVSEGARAPSAQAVAGQLERVLASPEFLQSERLRRFLRYVVEETLAGRGERLSEYAIGIDVFDRDESFDPQTSSIVRVEASRLRAKLEKYNATDGRGDPVRLVLPRGTYVPDFRPGDHAAEPAAERPGTGPSAGAGRPRRKRLAAGLAAVALAALGAAALLFDRLPFDRAPPSRPDASPVAQAASLAVLPLRNLSERTDDAYFSEGMTEALITDLARAGSFRVISTASAMAYRNVERPAAEIARELGVSHVVEGSVLRVGDKVRITTQLIEAGSERYVWAESYEREIADVLALQEEVVGKIVAALSTRVAQDGEAAPRQPPAIDPAAYEAYLRGRYFQNMMTEAGFRRGIDYFKQAIAKEPDFAPAYSGMASCYCLLGGHGFEIVDPREGMPAAKAAVLEALRLDDTLAEAHAFLGIIRLKFEWDWAGAEESFRRAIALNPSYAQARIFYSFFLEAMGRQDAAVREAEEARAIDPLSLAANVNLGWQYLQADRPEDARAVFESTAELNPAFWGVHWGLGHYHRRNGAYAEAIAAFRRAVDSGGGHAMPLSALGYTYARAGRPQEARETLERLNALARNSYVSPVNVAVVHAGLGETGPALAALEAAYAQRSRAMAWLKVTRELDGLRAEPGFAALLRRVGLPQ